MPLKVQRIETLLAAGSLGPGFLSHRGRLEGARYQSDISMSYDQVFRCISAIIGQTCEERYLKIWARPDYALQCGDFVRVTITSPPYNGQYDMRILNKAFESALYSDVMELTLYDGFASDI